MARFHLLACEAYAVPNCHIMGKSTFLKVLSKDVTTILKEVGRDGSVSFLRMGAAMLAGFAEKVVLGKGR